MAGRGGKRAGAGRKKVGVIRKVSVNMPQEFWDYADNFPTITECIKELWAIKNETSNQIQNIVTPDTEKMTNKVGERVIIQSNEKYSLISNSMAFIKNVGIDAKNDDALVDFVSKHPEFSGRVTLMKDTKFKEDNGETYQRHYEYEVDCGKYRKKQYSKEGKWKVVASTT